MQDEQTSNCNQIEIDNSNWLQNHSNLQQVIMIIDRNHYRNKNFAEYCFFDISQECIGVWTCKNQLFFAAPSWYWSPFYCPICSQEPFVSEYFMHEYTIIFVLLQSLQNWKVVGLQSQICKWICFHKAESEWPAK